MNAPPSTSRLIRGEARRQQVLNAAKSCFREYGFHGTSIHRIAGACGMSVGHIYHYFDNKEAIVTGIVEQYLHETLEIVDRMEEASQSIGIVEAVVIEVQTGMLDSPADGCSGLGLEIFAEASRNPVIADAIQRADRTMRDRMREILQQQPALRALPKSEFDARTTVINALFDGLSIRALCDPSMGQTATAKVMQRVVRMLLED